MPKKHNQKFSLSRSNYVHPSLQSARSSHGEASAAATAGVNERLNQLRLSQSPKASPEKVNQITAAVTQKSVPPNLREVLNIPETAAPRPKPGARRRRLPGQPPGPAAPQSWMEGSRHAPAYARAQARKRARYAARPLEARSRPPDVASLPGVEMPTKGSLLDQAFKAMALDWEFISEYEQLNLATIPPRFKSVLLSYLSTFGPEDGIGVGDLRLLFQTETEIPGGTGTQEFSRLDLTSLIWGDLTLPTLERYLTSGERSKSGTAQRRETAPQREVVLDSWDEEAPEISPTLSNGRFSALTHLSLARPDSNSPLLWSSLLLITGSLPTITHLSLAYWPAPSLTPNSNTASVHARGSPGPVQMSGTGFYSHRLDNDFSEASNILRRLSLNTLCLEWLDLEGCNDWWQALIWAADQEPEQHNEHQPATAHDEPLQQNRRDRLIGERNEWSSQISLGPDWNGPWRFIRYIRLSQGWVPGNLSYGALRGVNHGVIKSLQEYLDRGEDPKSSIESVEEVSASEVIDWALEERRAQQIKRTIQRRRTGGNIVDVDHGWTVS